MDTEYEAGIDAPMLYVKKLLANEYDILTPTSEADGAEAFTLAEHKPLPVGYVVKAIVRCNQLDPFRMVSCDFARTIEARRESVEALARRALGIHFRIAHPYMTRDQRITLQRAVHFNFRDIG